MITPKTNTTLFDVLSAYQSSNLVGKEKTTHIHFIVTGDAQFGGSDYSIELANFYLDIGGGMTSIEINGEMSEVKLTDKNRLRMLLSLDPTKVTVKSWEIGLTARDRDSGEQFPEIALSVEDIKELSVPNINYRNMIQAVDD